MRGGGQSPLHPRKPVLGFAEAVMSPEAFLPFSPVAKIRIKYPTLESRRYSYSVISPTDLTIGL